MVEAVPRSLVVSRRLTGAEAQETLGTKGTLYDLQNYLSKNIAADVERIISAENALRELSAPEPQFRIHISFSWG